MKIGDRTIGDGPPYIVAEISGNHCGDLKKAVELIEAAAWIKADAVKFQYYTPDSITLDCNKRDFVIKNGPWKGRKLYELYTKAHTPPDWMPYLFEKAADRGITAFASVFDRSSVDALEELNCPAYKIASMEIIDTPLISYAAATGKPLIISTGMAVNPEVTAAWEAGRRGHDIPALLHCVSGYPTPVEEGNLWRITQLRDVYDSHVGISDHTPGWEIPLAATVLGASIIEKHLCLFRGDASEDAQFSLEPHEFQSMIERVKSIWAACQLSEAKSEKSSRQLRRSLYVTENVAGGTFFTPENVRSIRPGYGMPPHMIDAVLGKRAKHDIKRGTALKEDMIQ